MIRMMNDPRTMIEFVARITAQRFAAVGYIWPVFVAWPANAEALMVLTPENFGNAGDKDALAECARDQFAEHKVDRFVFLSEAWIVDVKSRTAQADALMRGRMLASQHPDRIEVVQYTAETRTSSLAAFQKIIRKPDRKPELAALEFGSSGMNFGRFSHLLAQGTVQ